MGGEQVNLEDTHILEKKEEVPKEIAAKVALIFEKFDLDKDSYLNQLEMGKLTDATTPDGDQNGVSDQEWEVLSKVLSFDPRKGIKWTQLIIIYTKLASHFGADLRKDFEILFPNTDLSKR